MHKISTVNEKRCRRSALVFLFVTLSFTWSLAQTTVSGTVTDGLGSPLPGTNIIEKGTTNGSQTDADGRYSIAVSDPQSTLVFSFIGFLSKEVKLHGRASVDVSLEEDISRLAEIVIIGYGSVKKSDNTGSVVAVKSDDLNKGIVLSPEQLLQGKAAGVNVSLSSGRPGAASTVRIRGANSINFSNQPLFVVDGVPLDFQTGDFSGASSNIDRSNTQPTNPLNIINPSDIERIDILKDASATAIYGSRAANGVIIITTKKAAEGISTLSYDTYVGVSTIREKYPVLSASQVRQFAADNPDLTFNDGGANTDWQDEVFRTSVSQFHSLLASGGTEKTKYLASLGYQNQEGIIISSGVETITGRLNLNSKFIEDKLILDGNILYGVENSDNVPSVGSVGGDSGGDVIRDALRASPTLPVLDENSPYTGGYTFIDALAQNPVEQAVLHQDLTASKRLIGNLTATLNLFKGFNFLTRIGYTQENILRQSYMPLSSRGGSETGGIANYQTRDNNSRLLETTIDYSTGLSGGKHRLKALLGYSWQEFERMGNYIRRSGFVEDIIGFNGIEAGENIDAATSNASVNKIISFFGRLNYDILDKYLFTFTLRRDGSTRFGPNQKWGNFPSGAFAWKISDENFLANSAVISGLKLRLSYGVTGNQEISNFGSQALIAVSQEINPEIGLIANPVTFANPDLKWETTRQTNIGLDFGFMDHRISGSLDFYRKVTDDLILRFAIPQPSAVNTRLENVGEVENRGIELTTNVEVLSKNDLNIDFYGNLSINKNEIISLSKGSSLSPEMGILRSRAPQPQTNDLVELLREGEEIGTYFGLDFIGANEDGEEMFRDVTDDSNIDANDRIIIGQNQPDLIYGFGTNITFKGFNLNAFFRGVQGFDLYNSLRNDLENIGFLPNLNVHANTVNSEITTSPSGVFSNRFLEDASFLRLENATLGYTVNTDNIPYLQGLNVYVTGQNLFVLTGYSGFDPEVTGVSDYLTYPRPRTFILGLKARF